MINFIYQLIKLINHAGAADPLPGAYPVAHPLSHESRKGILYPGDLADNGVEVLRCPL